MSADNLLINSNSRDIYIRNNALLKQSLRLYVVTDRTWLNGRSLEDQVDVVLRSGGTFLQLREKSMPYDEMVQLAHNLKAVAKKHQVPFIINDDMAVALATDADGVHVGQSDISASEARARIGPHKILGVSVQNVAQAIKAEAEGADYLGVGAVFPTGSKDDADAVSLDTLREICDVVSIPVVAIGGINLSNLRRLKTSGIFGVAVISAIFAAEDIGKATEGLKWKIEEVLR